MLSFRFNETVEFFYVKPKPGENEVTPEYFFSLWHTFCQDFKDHWKREQQRIIKLRSAYSIVFSFSSGWHSVLTQLMSAYSIVFSFSSGQHIV